MSERRGKYNAKKVTINGYIFDSKAEAQQYQYLVLAVKAGLITQLYVHPRFLIVPKDIHGRALYYVADFQYHEESTDLYVVEDVKGVRTAVYNLKRRLFQALYPIYDFREIAA